LPVLDQGRYHTLSPGTYVLDPFPVELTFDIPEGGGPGWHVGLSTANNVNLLWYTPPDLSVALFFWSVDNVFVDPCDAGAGELDPPLGPSVDDLVSALTNLPGFDATSPVDVTVGDFQGKELELTVLDSGSDCPEVLMWRAGDVLAGDSPGGHARLLILDVAGSRVVIAPIIEEPVAAAETQLRQILDSLRVPRGG
jgi:hypothetical protein